jgi:chemotaxis protein histidine kinase CheA/ActR/RegA family two-component response regulator
VKLNDLIEALATEIVAVQPDLERLLDKLANAAADDPAFMDVLDQYTSQTQRMGEAAEMAGFSGLRMVCAHVVENTLLAPSLAVAERGPLTEFLRRWPLLIVYYLRNLGDPSAGAGLVDHLVHAPSPLADDQALKIAHMLGAMDAQVQSTFGAGETARPIVATAEDVALVMPEDVDQKLIEGFFTEAPEQARYLVQLATNIVSGEGDSSDLIAAKRVVHTLKGSGAIIGLRGLTSLGHNLEDILEHFERHGSEVAKPAADALLDAAYCLEQMVGYVMGSDDYPDQAQSVLQNVLDLANRIDRGESLDVVTKRVVNRAVPQAQTQAPQDASGSGSAAAASDAEAQGDTSGQAAEAKLARRSADAPTASPIVTASPTAALRVSVERVDELFRVSGEVSVHTAAMEARMKALADGARALLAQNLRVQKRLFELETVVDVRALTMRTRGNAGGAAADGPKFDPLEMDQYSELHSTAHALMEEAADARALASRLEEEIARTMTVQMKQQRLSKDLQHLVISTRMTEVGVLASRLQRNVRSTCQATGKQAELVLHGGDTLIDSDVLNRLADPLLHMLRNAVDHGLELPAQRIAAGKSETGKIVLTFSRQGQQVVLNCRDDGRGLDHAAIRRRAVERGLLQADQAASDDELARMILMSGFSTRQTINELSGRGVGLDVVREWAAAMNGSIRVSSKTGEGCTIELRFAASLSTMQSLIVEASGQRFALPSVQIERAVPRGVGDFERHADRLVYRITDKSGAKVHPAGFLSELTGLPNDPKLELSSFDAVIVRIDDKVHALAVERLIDAREVLVKNPGRYAKHVRGVAGLSILGDGSISVNLDLPQLLGQGARRGAAAQSEATQAAPQDAAVSALPSVLIVDDALSVRNSLLQMVQDAGYRAATARDGVEAVDALTTFRPDIVLTDLEMPNMNGIELTSHIRGRADLKDLPVIMITSRSQEKHRRMAEQAGVSNYLTKPYNDAELLRTIRSSLAAA